MTGATGPQRQEGAAINAINIALDKLGKPTQLLDRDLFIPDRAALGRVAGQGIAYVQDGESYDEIRSLFARLGAEIGRRMQL